MDERVEDLEERVKPMNVGILLHKATNIPKKPLNTTSLA